MIRLILKLLLISLALILISELGVRTVLEEQLEGVEQLEDFYRSADETADTESIDILFLGSSRVAGVVRPEIISNVIQDSTEGINPEVINIGKGFSSLALHYYGLQRLYQNHPDHMRGALIMIEAPSGIPLYQKWSGKWVHSSWPTLFGPLLTVDNLVPFVLQSSNSLSTKAYAIASGPLKTVRFGRHFRPKLKEKINDQLMDTTDEPSEVDLSDAGGVRTDSAGVALVRERMIRQMEESRSTVDSTLWQQWGETITADIVQLARANGGDVAFFEMPESSYQFRRYPSTLRQSGERAFRRWAKGNELTMLNFPNFNTTDDDFPDLLHMRMSRSREYSTLIARNLVTLIDE